MKKGEATRIRLDEAERKKLEEISAVTGLPISACIRALIGAFIKDFDKNKGEICFPIPMDTSLRIWSAIQNEYEIPSYIDSLPKLEKFLLLMQTHHDKKQKRAKAIIAPARTDEMAWEIKGVRVWKPVQNIES